LRTEREENIRAGVEKHPKVMMKVDKSDDENRIV
jgi:hypothetical protein